VKHYGETAIIKDKLVSIIVEYVPLPIALMHWAKAGKSNEKQEIPPESIESTKMDQTYDKENHRTMFRSPHSQTTFSRSHQPSHKSWPDNCRQASMGQKNEKEPRRCLRCQTMGSSHLAVECDQPTTCGTCSKNIER